MAKSFYKGQRLGTRPPCLLCMGPGEGAREQLHLPYGVSVWLCGAHRSAGFQRRRAGRDFVASLWRAWEAGGCLTRARSRALDAHRARLLDVRGPRSRPGSYAWPELRREAERRFAAGEPPWRVAQELRERARGGTARPPSARTLRRWFQEGRWLGDSGSAGRAAPPSAPAPAGPARNGRGYGAVVAGACGGVVVAGAGAAGTSAGGAVVSGTAPGAVVSGAVSVVVSGAVVAGAPSDPARAAALGGVEEGDGAVGDDRLAGDQVGDRERGDGHGEGGGRR